MLLAASAVATLALLGVADGSANSSTNGAQAPPTTIETSTADVPAPEPATTPTTTPSTTPSEPVDDSVPDDTDTTDTTLLGDDGTDGPGSAEDDTGDAAQISIRVEPTIRSTDIAPATIVLAVGVLLAVELA